MIDISFPSGIDSNEVAAQFESYLKSKSFKVKKKKLAGYYLFTVSVREPLDILWIGVKLKELSPNVLA